MITLYLVSYGLLKMPSLYLSDFFEKHRSSYYDALSRVRTSNDLIHWIKFFLTAVYETSEKGRLTFDRILALKNKVDKQIVTLNRKAVVGQKLINYLYKKPVVIANDIANYLDITAKSANSLISDFENLGVLREMTGFRRNRVYIFKEYTDLF
ncbi:MAG TPA: hypothetical protein DF296_02550 [Candidatus Margulisbacteria bacterium]|nr:MAG: hypothetical protein A2X43_12550 [Candidatus Margulisbacteria bacterium GWD2_39_127]OGI01923.1 MAG: hypothetical protein A2X42_11855 [Candidatus Margulisbacteria bacterium GWF2_38_17]OGI11571.1 MAG: hypothetical protein A2X41_10080 [Candidatus Margulisbacteria bacterium GWE2_39_32]HAR62122.1 hypothetical protein [Candidatus Margulisiibacteriota bacterium]HCT84059.1 hypothetical protein [Candidatus Margulisiibacteriota bacterium]